MNILKSFVIIINYRYQFTHKRTKNKELFARQCIDHLALNRYKRQELMSLWWNLKWEKYSKEDYLQAIKTLEKEGLGEKVTVLKKVPP